MFLAPLTFSQIPLLRHGLISAHCLFADGRNGFARQPEHWGVPHEAAKLGRGLGLVVSHVQSCSSATSPPGLPERAFSCPGHVFGSQLQPVAYRRT